MRGFCKAAKDKGVDPEELAKGIRSDLALALTTGIPGGASYGLGKMYEKDPAALANWISEKVAPQKLGDYFKEVGHRLGASNSPIDKLRSLGFNFRFNMADNIAKHPKAFGNKAVKLAKGVGIAGMGLGSIGAISAAINGIRLKKALGKLK
jgi:hypothetical protein